MFTTFRRHYLDQSLLETMFSGDVLDVGGKKEGKKGRFRPPLSLCSSWRYVNIDPATKPDFLASADLLPLPNHDANFILLAETIEHLEFPEKALAEAHRILRSGGKLVLTVPFLYPVHGDPYDFQRWTPEKFRRELGRLGFSDIIVQPMGGLFAVICDAFENFCQAHYVQKRKPPFIFRVGRVLMRSIFLPLLLRWDSGLPFQEIITTGYFVTARKLQ